MEATGSDMVTTVAGVYDILFGMRRCRINLPNRCYHLISRVAHRALEFEGLQAANRKGRYDKEKLLWQFTVAIKSCWLRQFGKHLKGFCKMVNVAFVFMIFLVLLSPGCKSVHHKGVSTELVEEAFLNFDDGVMERLSNVGTVFPVEVSSGARLEVLEFVDVDSKETLRLFSATGAVLRAELWARSVRSECRKFSALQAFWMIRVQKPSREGGVGSVLEQPQTSGKWKSKKMLQVDELLPFIDSIRDALDKHLDKREVRRIFGVPNRDTADPTSSDENGSIWTYEITGLPNNCNSYNLTIGFDADGRLDLWIFSVLKHRMYSIDWFNSDYLLRGDPCLFQ